MKKIRVSGCLNCPYMERSKHYIDENETEDWYSCQHPSFISRGSDFPEIHTDTINNIICGNGDKSTPLWCPLEDNN